MTDVVKFGTIDRYFSDKNEKRIGRIAFLLRFLFIIIMVSLLSMAINMWLFNIVQLTAFYIIPIIVMFGSIILILSVPMLAKKRSHDYDSDGKIVWSILIGTLGINFLFNGYTLYTLYTGSYMEHLFNPSNLSIILGYILQGLGVASLVALLILLFRPGSIGANSYGEVIK